MVTILSSMIGTFFGGWIHRKLNLQEKGAATIVLIGAVLVVVFTGTYQLCINDLFLQKNRLP